MRAAIGRARDGGRGGYAARARRCPAAADSNRLVVWMQTQSNGTLADVVVPRGNTLALTDLCRDESTGILKARGPDLLCSAVARQDRHSGCRY